jgi:hypothetical protein
MKKTFYCVVSEFYDDGNDWFDTQAEAAAFLKEAGEV